MMRLRDIMTTNILTVSPDMTLRDVMTLFSGKHVSGAPVVAAGKVVGVISSTDLMDFVASLPGIPIDRRDTQEPEDWQPCSDAMDEENETPQAFFAHCWDDSRTDVGERIPGLGPEWNALEEHTVSEAMTRTVFSLPPGTAVEFAAFRMREAGVHRVLVMQGDALVGIVSTKDISDAVADHKLTARTFVFSPRVLVNEQSWFG